MMDSIESTDDSTTNLAAKARLGDRESFGTLFERIAPSLWTWASLRILERDRKSITPADIVQETWCRALLGLNGLDPATPFRYWLFRIAKNVLLEGIARLDRQRRHEGGEPSGSPFETGQLTEEITSVSLRLARHEALREFVTAVSSLPPEDRELLVRCGLEGEPVARAAQVLQISEAAAHKRWQRLRAELRTHPAATRLADLFSDGA